MAGRRGNNKDQPGSRYLSYGMSGYEYSYEVSLPTYSYQYSTVAYLPYLLPVQDFKDYKPRILHEYISKCTETHKITYGIVAYSFVIRVSLFVARVSNLLNFP